ncbi:hypothetical protein BJF78_26675 [Pseudonocardia sp. CNS-139]|nr:hypothetical protein BJF78_26675 [Pseudonocardia sp. CNS-139]
MNRLSPGDLALWELWKRATGTVWDRVVEDVRKETGLSAADFCVLTRVAESGGRLRQSRLGAAVGWPRSRLSHHLARMAERGLITRRRTDGGAEVLLTDAGQVAVQRAGPAHARAVHRHLLDGLDPAERAVLTSVLERLVRPL